jgi:hypothetical protein
MLNQNLQSSVSNNQHANDGDKNTHIEESTDTLAVTMIIIG